MRGPPLSLASKVTAATMFPPTPSQRDLPSWAGADSAVLTVCVDAQALPGLQARQHGARFLGRERVQWRSTLSRKLLDEALDGCVQARNWFVHGCARCLVHLAVARCCPR